MKQIWLQKLHIQNYGPYTDFEIEFNDKFNTIIGKNGVGKSYVLNAIKEFPNDKLSEANTNRNVMNKPKIKYYFQISSELKIDNYIIPKGQITFELTTDKLVIREISNIKRSNTDNLNTFKFQILLKSRNDPFIEKLGIQYKTFFSPAGSKKDDNGKTWNNFNINPDPNINSLKDLFSQNSIIYSLVHEYYGKIIDRIKISADNFDLELFPINNSNSPNLKDEIPFEYMIQGIMVFKLKKIIEIKPIGTEIEGFTKINNEEINNSDLCKIIIHNAQIEEGLYDTSLNLTKLNQFQDNFKVFIEKYQFNDLPALSFNIFETKLKILANLSETARIFFFELSEGQQWIYKFLFLLYPYFNTNEKNVLITIDEPGKSLHPEAQEYIYYAINKLAETFQIIYSTHMTRMLDYLQPKSIKLIQKKENHIKVAEVPENNILFVCDELQRLTPMQLAALIIEDDYKCIQKDLLKHFRNLEVFKRMQKELKDHIDDVINLGTVKENQMYKLISNTFFLLNPQKTYSCSEIKEKKTLEQILIFQCVKNKTLIEGKKLRFQETIKNWEYKLQDNKIALISLDNIKKKINSLKNKIDINLSKIKFQHSMLILPESVWSLHLLEPLKALCDQNEIILITGLNHITLQEFQEFNSIEFENKTDIVKLYEKNEKTEFYLNLTVIYDYSDKKWYVQPKNIPVITKEEIKSTNENINPEENKRIIKENIMPLIPPVFYIFDLSIGRIAVFTCKDFLVYHEVIPRWMKLHEVELIVIPSFTQKVGPFIRKMQEITSKEIYKNCMFAYANLAEYGGSNVINITTDGQFEPDQTQNTQRQEELLIFNLEKEGDKIKINRLDLNKKQKSEIK